jgi:hypothetical protein
LVPLVESPEVYRYLTVPHRIIVWPQVHAHLINANPHAESALQAILKKGTPHLIKVEMEKHSSLLPCGPGLPSLQSGTRSEFPSMTPHHVQKYTEAYFHTFNACRPILDYDAFSNDIVGKILQEGFVDGDPQSVLALLVFALGQVAIEGTSSQPLFTRHHKQTGLRGGTQEEPPGIEMFNEARRRLGSVLDAGTLENVQILLLQATYYETNCRHVDFWRSTVAASMECQIIIKCRHTDPSTKIGDLTVRAYWTCVLNEELYHLDLDLPQTGIHTLQDETPLPHFRQTQISLQQEVAEVPFVQYHFLALITLRRLVVSITEAVHQCTSLCLLPFGEYMLTTSQLPRAMQRSLMTTGGLLTQ